MLKFNFNPKGTINKDPGAFRAKCELVSMVYTQSKKGNMMVKITWKYGDCVFNDYHTCFDDKHKDAEAVPLHPDQLSGMNIQQLHHQ